MEKSIEPAGVSTRSFAVGVKIRRLNAWKSDSGGITFEASHEARETGQKGTKEVERGLGLAEKKKNKVLNQKKRSPDER